MFCSEPCITEFFAPEIHRLEKEYFRRLSPNDLTGEEREGLAHLRWITLQEPDEIWREKTLNGDHRFTLISEFQPEDKKVWSICICLFLRGEPSFLYLAFSTRNAAMANHYRKGERVEVVREKGGSSEFRGESRGESRGKSLGEASRGGEGTEAAEKVIDGLAEEWTEDETLRAQMREERRLDDIPISEFALYQSCLEETLDSPDEVWSLLLEEKSPIRLYHFVKSYPEEKPEIWYIVVARELDDEEQIEILDAFPTRDLALVNLYRKGNQEVGAAQEAQPSVARVVH